jgi:peptidoglycan-associated lipoprotein
MLQTVKRFLIGCLLLITTSGILSAQNKKVVAADRLFNNKEYYEALNAYKKALEGVKGKALKAELTYKQALCFMMTNDPKKAEVWFGKAIKAKYQNPEATLYLAEMMRINGKYDEALAEYEKYVKLKPDDARGSLGVESCKLAVNWKGSPTKHQVSNVQPLNSKYDDFSPIFSRKNFNEVIFTSSREGAIGNGQDGWTGEAFSDLYEAKVDKNGKWSTPMGFKEPLNSKFNDGSATLNEKYTTMFYTRCEYDKNKIKGCQIFTTKKKGNSWDEPVLVPFADDTFTVGHPWISDDEMTLFFASDMPGGLGGRDIWMSKMDKKGKKWGNPVNLGPQINTQGDELYPTLRDDSTLYFASNGLVGMGGLDMFEAKFKGGKWTGVANLKHPLNSSADDFGIVFRGKQERGYFSSCREGGKGGADIYEFTVPPVLFTLGGIVYDFESKAPVVGAKVVMVDQEGMTFETTTDKMGSYYYDNTKFKEDNTYQISVTAENYFGDKGTETTKGETSGSDHKKDFFIKPVPKDKPVRLPEILYALNSAELRPESKDSLNGLITTLRDNPQITIELMSHTDSRGSSKSNIELSQRRAQSVVNYLIEQKIDPARLGAKGMGETKLLNKCKDGVTCTEEEHQRNRRTEFKITSFTFVPKEGSPEFVAPKIETVDEDEAVETDVQEQQRENIKIENAPPAPTPTPTPAPTPEKKPKN